MPLQHRPLGCRGGATPHCFFLVLLASVLVALDINMTSMMIDKTRLPSAPWYPVTTAEQQTGKRPPGGPLRIAVLSTFVSGPMWDDPGGTIRKMADHIVNRECYCHLWNYDCILNQTMELGLHAASPDDRTSTASAAAAAAPSNNTTPDPWWLKFGTWERVAHIQAALPNYDWVLFGDVDYIIKDMTRPIESFIREFELHGKDDVHVLVPVDNNFNNRKFTFSAFAILIKNSPFGRRLLENWRAFAMGLCPNGNFEDASEEKRYSWEHSDQSGLWYALMKTHMDFNPNDERSPDVVKCDKTRGIIVDHKDENNKYLRLEFNRYFRANGYRHGNYGIDLVNVPDNQQIAWSRTHANNDSMSGLGVDRNWFPGTERYAHNAFALHLKKPSIHWDPKMRTELGVCKRVHGCSVSWNETAGVRAGCGKDYSDL